MKKEYEIFKQIIDASSSIVVFTGAGMSTASGIPDFRGDKGLYFEQTKTGYSPEEIVSHSFFKRNTKEFYEFYKTKMVYPNAKPNKAHKFFADLQRRKNVIVVTQNIDGLHQQAGSKTVYELHGSVHYNYCQHCYKEYPLDFILKQDGVPHCEKCGGVIKPDVVLYEEELNDMIVKLAISAIMTADTLIIIGTSLSVYPAAGFIRYFKGNNLVLINKDKTPYDNSCDLVINEDIVKVIENIEK